jgi:cob(I)alamin adenosyltransferase
MNKGLIHIYTGDGKGKTTAAAGLAVRARGHGKNVVFAQFLKSGVSGELKPMEELGIIIIRSSKKIGFTFTLNADEKNLCRNEQQLVINNIKDILIKDNAKDNIDVLILDEVLDALSTGMLNEDQLQDFIKTKPEQLEIILTGRPVPSWLIEKADYVSEIKKIKHPFDNGTKARKGIEN